MGIDFTNYKEVKKLSNYRFTPILNDTHTHCMFCGSKIDIGVIALVEHEKVCKSWLNKKLFVLKMKIKGFLICK